MAHIAWRAPEFLYREKSVSWYWCTIILSTVLIGIAAWQRNLFFGFFVVAAELLVLTWGHKKPSMIEFSLADDGMYANGKKLGARGDFESFSHESRGEEHWQRVVLVSRHRMRPPLKILAPLERVEEIKTSLRESIPEVEHEPTLIESIEELIGF